MRRVFKKINKSNVVATIFFILSLCILGATAIGVARLDVLEDFYIVVPEQRIVVGEEVVIESRYKKVREVTGESTRYIECKTKDGVPLRYELSKAKANRAVAEGGTGISMIAPGNIPDLPAQCRYTIHIEYDVLPFKHVFESANSEWFTLYPAEDEKSDEQAKDDAAKKTSQSLAQVKPLLPESSYPYPQLTPATEEKQLDISQNPGQNSQEPTRAETPVQPAPTPRPPTPAPALVEQPKTGLRAIPLIDGVLSLIGL